MIDWQVVELTASSAQRLAPWSHALQECVLLNMPSTRIHPIRTPPASVSIFLSQTVWVLLMN